MFALHRNFYGDDENNGKKIHQGENSNVEVFDTPNMYVQISLEGFQSCSQFIRPKSLFGQTFNVGLSNIVLT